MNNQTVKLQLNHKSKQSLRHLTASYKRRTSFVQASNREKREETDIYNDAVKSSNHHIELYKVSYTGADKLSINAT